MLHRREFLYQTGLVLGGVIFSFPGSVNSDKNNMILQKDFDVIIIGGSYSGLAAAMALGRALRNVLIIDAEKPCNIQTPYSHNFLTNDGATPISITMRAREQVEAYPTVKFLKATATVVNKLDSAFQVTVKNGDIFSAKKIILATGIRDILPDIPGLSNCWGISVLHCPYCHGYEVRDLPTGILANGDLAFELATLISNWTNDLTVLTQGTSTLTNAQTQKLVDRGIKIIDREIESLEHNDGYLHKILFKTGEKLALTVLYTKPPFEQHSDFQDTLKYEMTADGYIKIDNTQRTSIPGVFACGDNTTRIRTIANAVSMGTIAGMMANREMIEECF